MGWRVGEQVARVDVVVDQRTPGRELDGGDRASSSTRRCRKARSPGASTRARSLGVRHSLGRLCS